MKPVLVGRRRHCDNNTGLNLTIEEVKDYLNFLAKEAYSKGMLIRMKNAADIAKENPADFVKKKIIWTLLSSKNVMTTVNAI